MRIEQEAERIDNGLPPRITYAELNAKQKEIYNFQKVAALLADYGFNCIKLSDDWQGADFLAYHKDWEHTLRVQLKAPLTIATKYLGKDLHIAFKVHDVWHVIEHDRLVELCGEHATYLQTQAWKVDGLYQTTHPNPGLRVALEPYALLPAPPEAPSVPGAAAQPASSLPSPGPGQGKKFEVSAAGTKLGPLSQKDAVLATVQLLVEAGVTGERIQGVLNPGPFRSIGGTVDPRDLWPAMTARYELPAHDETHWFLDSPIYEGGRTWVMRNNVWGPKTEQKIAELCALAPGSVTFGVV